LLWPKYIKLEFYICSLCFADDGFVVSLVYFRLLVAVVVIAAAAAVEVLVLLPWAMLDN
jgi:hypothetical protein